MTDETNESAVATEGSVGSLEARLERAVRARDEFLDAAAHDLRTPLTALSLHIDSLTKGPLSSTLSPAVIQRIAAMRKQVDHLTRLTERFTDVTRATTDRLVLRAQSVDLVEVARSVADRFEDPLRWAGCPLEFRAPQSLPVHADPLRIDEVIGNLLQNATKYASGQPVLLEVDGAAGVACVRVADRGPGVPPALRDRVFEKFDRGEAEPGTGLGLGLWISQRILHAHGGTLRLEDTPGGGATFLLELPVDKQEGIE